MMGHFLVYFIVYFDSFPLFFRIIGALIIVFGLYLIIWGKSKDSTLTNSISHGEELVHQETIPDNPDGTSKSDITDGIIREDRDVEASV